MQILSLYYTHKPGGFCKRLYRLLNALSQRGHRVSYISLDAPPESLKASVHFICMPFIMKRRSGLLFWFLFTLWAPLFLLSTTRRLKADRLVMFGAFYAFIAIPAHSLSQARLIVFVRSLVFKINRITRKPPLACWLSDLCERTGLRAADAVVAMSESMANELQFFMRSKRSIEILPNDVPAPQPLSKIIVPVIEELRSVMVQGKQLVLISGVFDLRKNLQLVLEAFEKLQASVPEHNLTLVVAGDGPELRSAQRWVKDHKLDCIYFTGWLKDLAPLYQITSLIIHPALHEGMPNSVLEAWGYDLPALVARTPELQEMVPASELWFSTDNSDELVAQLIKIAGDKSQLEKLRHLTQTCSKQFQFDWDERAVAIATS